MNDNRYFHLSNLSSILFQHVVFIDVNEDQGKATAERLNKAYPGKVTFIKCDISDETSIAKVFDSVIDRVQRLDVIFNNAGLMIDSDALWRKTCEVNVVRNINI